MEKILTFFRVFDLAFFVPGIVLLTAFGLLPEFIWFVPESLRSEPIGLTRGIVLVTLGLTTAYSLGLWAHAVVWIFVRPIVLFKPILFFRKLRGDKLDAEAKAWIPFPDRFSEPTRTDLLLYFWYLRATCWTLAFAVLVAAAFFACRMWPSERSAQLIVGALIFSLPLALQGRSLNNLIEAFKIRHSGISEGNP